MISQADKANWNGLAVRMYEIHSRDPDDAREALRVEVASDIAEILAPLTHEDRTAAILYFWGMISGAITVSRAVREQTRRMQ